jgi:hypothetical protein
MIKATANAQGRKLLILGLSYENLNRFRDMPGDTFIRVDGRELDLPIDVMIFSGETEAKCTELLEDFLSPATKVQISPRQKS